MKKFVSLFLISMLIASCGDGSNNKLEAGKGTSNEHKTKDAGVPEKLSYEDSELILNGSGIRKKYFMDVYVCGLYLPEKNKDADEIIHSDGPLAVRLHIISKLITRDNMERVVREGFVRSTDGKTANIQSQIDELMTNFKKTPVNVGDLFDMWYIPGKGLQGYKNEKPWGPIIVCGPEYRSALIGIWLSDDPIDPDLKTKMLGL